MYYLTDVCQAGNYRHLDCGWRNSQMPPNPRRKSATSIRPATSQNPRRKSRICTKLWECCIYRQWLWWPRLSTHSGRILRALSHECNACISMLSIIFFFRLWSKPKRPKMLLGVAVASWAPPLSRPWSKQLKPHQQLAETWSKALHDRCTAIPWTTWAFASTGENRSLKKEKLHLSIKGGACTAIYWLADHQSGSIFSSNLQHLIKVRGGQGVKN